MRFILPIIVVAQFLCSSVWFVGNSIITDIGKELSTGPDFLANMTSIIQFGFISGTLFFAVFTIADRFSPSRVFFVSSILAGLFNLGISINHINVTEVLVLRFLTGFFLAGIYPVGMKIASDYYSTGLGKSLGFLVGALVIGTAFPHLLKNLSTGLPWKYVVYTTSALSLLGGSALFLFVPNGPYRKASQKPELSAFLNGFRHRDFRSAAFGYFGHMWELYTFWAFVPVMLNVYNNRYPAANINVSLSSFYIIGSGGLACMVSGMLSQLFGAKKIATMALFSSGLCCMLSPFFLLAGSTWIILAFLFIWGLVVIADSPLFSTLVAQSAPPESRGSSLTIVNCIGFSITIISIQCINFFSDKINNQYLYMLLGIGPALGLMALMNKKVL